MIDELRMNTAVFLRLMELSREEICNDADLHDIAEAVLRLSQEKTVDMGDYQAILDYMNSQNVSDCDQDQEKEVDPEIAELRRLINY